MLRIDLFAVCQQLRQIGILCMEKRRTAVDRPFCLTAVKIRVIAEKAVTARGKITLQFAVTAEDIELLDRDLAVFLLRIGCQTVAVNAVTDAADDHRHCGRNRPDAEAHPPD